jgi:hypothetical protein
MAVEGQTRNYVIDDKVIIAIPGLRTVNKVDYPESSIYLLTVTYKGSVLSIKYKTKEDRDSTYNKIILLIEEHEMYKTRKQEEFHRLQLQQ